MSFELFSILLPFCCDKVTGLKNETSNLLSMKPYRPIYITKIYVTVVQHHKPPT